MSDSNPPSQYLRSFNYSYSFTLKKGIRTWQDFTSTFRSATFDEALNQASPEEIEVFWKNQLDSLSTQAEKICILVPAEISRNDPNDGGVDLKSDACAEKGANKTQSKQKTKDKKMASSLKVPINKNIV
jgi:hypothetical protein